MSKLVPLKIRPGAVSSGTEYESKGVWRDVDRVRWRGNALRPVGGWLGLTTDTHEGIARGGMGWTDASGNGWVAFGTAAKAYALDDSYNLTDITPAGLTSGSQDGTSYASPATTWQWASFGQIPIGCSNADGRIWEWDLNTANNLTQVTNSPTSCLGVHVTPEGFVFALGDGGDPRSIRWSDRADRTVWTAAATNQAGGFDLNTDGEIRFACTVRGQTLIVTTRDAWVARYVGYPDVYEFIYIGPCTATGHLCGVSTGDTAFWWGEGETFHVFDGGYVQELPCAVWEHLRTDADEDVFSTARSKVTTWHNIEFSEVWWLYESEGSSSDVDKYVAYDYVQKVWHYGECGATQMVNRTPVDTPIGLHVPATIGTDDFSSAGNWSLSSAQISGGTLSLTAESGQALNSTDYTGGKKDATYVLEYTVSNRTVGAIEVFFENNVPTANTKQGERIIQANGTVAILCRPSSDKTLNVTFADEISTDPGSAFDGDIDNLTVKHCTIYRHEMPSTYYYGDHYTSSDTPYAETGPFEIGAGEERVHVTRLIPDTQDSGELDFTFTAREYPTASETTYGPYTAANPTSVRFSGRQFKMKVEPVSSGVDWRSGVHRLEVTTGGRR